MTKLGLGNSEQSQLKPMIKKVDTATLVYKSIFGSVIRAKTSLSLSSGNRLLSF